MKCNFCDSEDNSIIFRYARFEKNNILRCNDCGLVFLEIENNNCDNDKYKKTIEAYYKNQYRKDKTSPILTAEEHFNDKITKKDIENRIQFIKTINLDLKNKKILEIGSASGGLMEGLQNEGAIVEGIELGDEYRKFSQRLGFNVYNKPVEDLYKQQQLSICSTKVDYILPMGSTKVDYISADNCNKNIKKKYDLIVSFHTIEHFADPKSALRSIYEMLIPKGIFLGEIPNQNDWRLSIFDDLISKRLHYNPFHYYYFSAETFKNYLIYSGFDDDKIKFETVDRYNSYIQLKNILCNYNINKSVKLQTNQHNITSNSINNEIEENIHRILTEQIFCSQSEDVRIRKDNNVEEKFNTIFAKAVNSELLGNCLRFISIK